MRGPWVDEFGGHCCEILWAKCLMHLGNAFMHLVGSLLMDLVGHGFI